MVMLGWRFGEARWERGRGGDESLHAVEFVNDVAKLVLHVTDAVVFGGDCQPRLSPPCVRDGIGIEIAIV